MGKKSISKYSNIQIGDCFDKWKVVGDVFVEKYAKVPCECECGTRQNVDAYTLTVGKSRSCIRCFNINRHGSNNNSWKGYESIPQSWFYRFKTYANKKNNPFTVTIEEVWSIYNAQNGKCALTGIPIGFENTKQPGTRWSNYICTASIDRIDSSKGYTLDNIQLVHKDVNMMKNAFDQDYFIQMCKAVAKNK